MEIYFGINHSTPELIKQSENCEYVTSVEGEPGDLVVVCNTDENIWVSNTFCKTKKELAVKVEKLMKMAIERLKNHFNENGELPDQFEFSLDPRNAYEAGWDGYSLMVFDVYLPVDELSDDDADKETILEGFAELDKMTAEDFFETMDATEVDCDSSWQIRLKKIRKPRN